MRSEASASAHAKSESPPMRLHQDLASGYGYERSYGGPAGQIERGAMHERNIQYGKMRLPNLMELYLLRHGIADNDFPTGKDADRPLPREGRRKLRETSKPLRQRV